MMNTYKAIFDEKGYLEIEELLNQDQVKEYQCLYNDFLTGKIDASETRSDLSGMVEEAKDKEFITQIMRPSRYVQNLDKSFIYTKTHEIAKLLMGDDMAFDFDMLINKPPMTPAETPWHQDEAYWIDMPDKRALSFWVSLDVATVDSGCMWYIPYSHKRELKKHQQIGKGALICEANENEGVSVELKEGGCAVHHGRTIHYSRGNSTNRNRRAFILNYRPEAMVNYERKLGYDHTGERKARERTDNLNK